jgi:DNA-binding NtrC family response regulator
MVQPFDFRPRVLVIDEDQRTADSLALALDVSGFRAEAAYTGQQAMELAATLPFHFIVSDTFAEIRGVKASLAISKILPGCPVLLMYRNGDSAPLTELAWTHGPRFDSIPKPAHPGRLIEKLREYSWGLNGKA